MEFIKKNIILTVILGITLLVSAYLVYMDWSKQKAVAAANAEVTNYKIQIGEYNVKTPAPLPENLDMIHKDTSIMKERTQDLQRLFGKPYRYPLLKFAETVGLSETKLMDKFREHCMNKATVTDNYALLDSFLQTFDEDAANPLDNAQQPAAPKKDGASKKSKEAFAAFMKAANERIPDSVPESRGKDALLQALGMPQSMYPTVCKDYIIKTQANFVKNFAPLIDNANVSRMTFDYASRVPSAEEIQPIIKKLQMFEDLFWRLREAKISQIYSIELLGSPLGDDAGVKDFSRFSYRIRLVSDLASTRALANLFQKAPLDNRFYYIRDFAAQINDDETRKFNDKYLASIANSGMMPPGMQGMQGTQGAPAQGTAPAADTPPEELPDYGQKLIGDSKSISVTLEFDYYIYSGDELKR